MPISFIIVKISIKYNYIIKFYIIKLLIIMVHNR
jgi:hypothetical protein